MNRIKKSLSPFALVMAAGIIGSAITLGVNQYVFKNDQVVTIEHKESLPSLSSRYESHVTTAPSDFTAAAEKVMPGVVHIKSTALSGRSGGRGNSQIPDIFRDFFGDGYGENGREPQPSVGSGSGVIISADGYIVTNNHVIDQADDIEVSLSDNRNYKAEVIGTDPSTDLALLKVDAEGLAHVGFANSDEVRVGEWVLAIGNPFNLTSTVTAGIVSAKARNINILRDRSAIESFIQTDAAVNPGNSGGALVNMDGELVGINTAIASRTGSYSGYSFAVPTNIVRKVMEDLMQHGVVQRAYLGVLIRNVDGQLAREKNLNLTNGIYVDSLTENGAAAEAGLKIGDVITAVDGKIVSTSPQLQAAIGTHRPGDKVSVKVNRKGTEKTLYVVLRNGSGNTGSVEKKEVAVLSSLGAEFENVNKDLAERLNIEGGVKVSKLNYGKLKKETNMRSGFIITKVDGKKIRNIDELKEALDNKSGGVMMEGVYEDYPGDYYYAFGM